MWYNDTLAKCTFVWVDDNFIEISSVSPVALGREGLSVSQYQDPSLSDSIKVYFSLPNYTGGLNITVYTNTFEGFKLNYSETHKELALPRDGCFCELRVALTTGNCAVCFMGQLVLTHSRNTK